jgi:hypothetical protein
LKENSFDRDKRRRFDRRKDEYDAKRWCLDPEKIRYWSRLTTVTVAEIVSSGEGKLMNHQKLFDSATSVSDWLKSVSNHFKWMNQKKNLIQSANNLKKRRSLISKKRYKKSRFSHHQKRCKKRRFKIPKPLYNKSSKTKFLVINLNSANLKLGQLFQSWGDV